MSVAQNALQPQQVQPVVVTGLYYAPRHCETSWKISELFQRASGHAAAEVAEVAEVKDINARTMTRPTPTSTFLQSLNCTSKMADESQQRAVNTAFAPPPPLWKHFTTENIEKLDKIKADASKNEDGRPKKKEWSAADLRSLELPSELSYLVPPDIPEGQYSVFGELQAVGIPA